MTTETKVLQTKVAVLESHIDMLESELSYLNHLLTSAGFPQGIQTLKLTLEEIASNKNIPSPDSEDDQDTINFS